MIAAMEPPEMDHSFWQHFPHWVWSIIVVSVAVFFLYEAVKNSAAVAAVFGRLGKAIYDRAVAPSRVLDHVRDMERVLERTADRLECATAYLVLDAEYHHEADLIVAESFPALLKLLPSRVPYTDFQARWASGWRP